MIAPITQDVPAPPAQVPVPIEFASFWRRWTAYFIDSIILALADSLVGLVLSSAPPAVPAPSSLSAVDLSGWWLATSAVIRLAVPTLYFVWAYSSGGQTIGKNVLGIKVVSIDGSALTLGQGILRTVGYISSMIVFSLGFLWSIWDPDKQTWHDKIAGTCVVRASVPSEALSGRTKSTVARARQHRWWVVAGVFTALAGIAFGSAVFAGVSEVRAMGPWPGRNASPQQMAAVDLAYLGLTLAQVKDARSSNEWAEGHYRTGAVAIYTAGQQEIVGITALQYSDTATASSEFGGLTEWAKENCRRSSYATWFDMGVIRCGVPGGHDRIVWSGYWILDIVALDGGQLPAQELADRVRDAIAANWKQER